MSVKLSIKDARRGTPIQATLRIHRVQSDAIQEPPVPPIVNTDVLGQVTLPEVKVDHYVDISARWYESMTVGAIKLTSGGLVVDRSRIVKNRVEQVEGKDPVVYLIPLAHLIFNGRQLCWMQGSNSDQCWPAVSGRQGFQSAEHQGSRNNGPLPEGTWLVRQSQYQTMHDRGLFEQLAAEMGRTAWPGGESSWGRNRIWLQPDAGTDTLGRSGFSIHGGEDPGSAGCIDMTTSMPDFTRRFLDHGQDLILEVSY